MTARDGRNITILDRHSLPGRVQPMLLLSPHGSHGDVEAEDASVHGVDQVLQPCLQREPVLALLAAHPESELRDDDRAGVALILVLPEPGDDARVPVTFGGLA